MKPDVQCEFCGKICKQQGYANHVRLKHKLKVNITEKIVELTSTPKLTSKSSPDLTSNSPNKLTTQVVTTVIEKTVTAIPTDVTRIGPRLRSQTYLLYSDYLKYYKENIEQAKKDWESLVELRFNAGHITATTGDKYKALESLSRDIPELYEIEKKVIRRCSIEAERLRSK